MSGQVSAPTPSAPRHLAPVSLIWPLLIVSVVTTIPYIQNLWASFLNWDDVHCVTHRPEVNQGISFQKLHWAFTEVAVSNWMPLTWLSYMLESHFFGLNSSVMHFTNLCLHTASTILVGLIIGQWTKSISLCVAVSLLFGIHPQHVETVCWVSERKGLLAVFFGLASILSWEKARQGGGMICKVLSLSFFALSLLSKQLLVTLPFLFVLLDCVPLRDGESGFSLRRTVRSLFAHILYFLISFAALAMAFSAQLSGGSVSSLSELALTTRLANAVQSLGYYLLQSLVPIRLSPFYRYPYYGVSAGETALCGAVVIVVIILGYRYRRVPGVVVGLLWFLGTLVPVLGLIQLGAAARADRYMYFPHIGLFLAVSRIVESKSWIRTKECTVLFLFGATSFGFLAYQYAAAWNNSISLWTECIRVDPENFLAYEQLAIALLVEDRVIEAERVARKALTFPENQTRGRVFTTLGSAILYQGREDEAVEYLRQAVEKTPEDYRALINLGFCMRNRDLTEARRLFEQALTIDPSNVEALGNLANCEAQLGNFGRAVDILDQALLREPENDQLLKNRKLFHDAHLKQP